MNIKVVAAVVTIALVSAGAIGAFILLQDNTRGESNLTSAALEIYGNADGDSNIDEADARLLEDYIEALKTKNATEMEKFVADNHFDLKFADANNDGTINAADVAQVRAIIDRTATTLWLEDGLNNDISVGLDISRIGAEYYANTELCLILGLADKVVAVDNAPYIYKDFYFTEGQQSHITNLVNMNEPDYPFVNDLDLDILLTFYNQKHEEKQTKIIGTDVVYLGLYNPDMSNAEGSNFIQGILKAGYIFNAVERAEAYAEWIYETRNKLADIAAGIPDAEKPTVLMSNYPSTYFINADTKTATVYCYTDPLGQACLLGGGKNVGELLFSDYNTSLSKTGVSIDALFNDDDTATIDYVFLHNVKYTYGGTVMEGVPDHGYLATSDAEMAAAWASATDGSHTLLVDLDPDNLYLIAGDFRNGPTGAVILGAYMGNILHPEHYSEIDPIELHNYYIQHWLGISDYDVAEDGVFLYHS